MYVRAPMRRTGQRSQSRIASAPIGKAGRSPGRSPASLPAPARDRGTGWHPAAMRDSNAIVRHRCTPPSLTLIDDQPPTTGGAGLADVDAVVAVLVVRLNDAVTAVFAQLA